MARRLRWSEQALDELDAILGRIARDAPRIASAVHDRIVARLDSLPDQPGQGRRVREMAGGYREVIVQSWPEILIVAVVHSARSLRGPPLR